MYGKKALGNYELSLDSQFRAFDNMLEGISVYKLIYNGNKDVVDGILEYMNSATIDTMNIDPEGAIGKRGTELFSSNYMEPVFNEINESLQNGEFKRFELYYPPTDRYFLISGFNLFNDYFAVLRVDITEQKRNEEEIRYHAFLLDHVNDAVIGASSNFKITYWNKGAEDMYGFTESEALGKPTTMLKPIYSIGQREKLINELEQYGTSKMIITTKHKNGEELIVDVNSARLKNDNGKTSGYVVVHHDITKQKKAEARLKNVLEETRQLSEELEISNEELQSTTEELHVSNEELRSTTEELQVANEELKVTNEEINNANNEILQAHKLLQDIINGFPSAIFVKDVEGRFLIINNKLEELLGINNEELRGKTDYDIITKELADYYRANDRRVIEEGRFITFEEEADLVDGHHIFLANKFPLYDIDGKIYGVSSISTDITEIKKLQIELNQARDHLEDLVNERTAEIEKRNLVLNGINNILNSGLTAQSEEELAQIALKSIENIIGSSFGFIYELNAKNLFNTIAISLSGWEECKIPHSRRLVMAGDLPVHGVRGRVIKDAKPIIFNDAKLHPEWIEPPEGHTKIKSFMGVPLIYGNKVFGEIGLAHKNDDFSKEDLETVELISSALVEALISYRNRNKLKLSINELERSNEELQQFAYITSHDLQEPLRTIASFTQLLERRYKGQFDKDADEFMDYIVGASIRMKTMIQGLLEYSRVGTKGHEFKEFKSEKALDNALLNLHSAIEEYDAIITHDPLPIIVGDEDQIIHVFQNLIGNALKFHKDNVKPIIHISAKKDADEFIFSIKDNGIGIEEQYNDIIFSIFKRLHTMDQYEGTGIGLALIKRIIDRHDGRLWVESKYGEGSTFYFTIPIEPLKWRGGIKKDLKIKNLLSED